MRDFTDFTGIRNDTVIGIGDSGVIFSDEPPQNNPPLEIVPHGIRIPVFPIGIDDIAQGGDTTPVYNTNQKPIRTLVPRPRIINNVNGATATTATTGAATPAVTTDFNLATFAQDNALLLLLAAGGIGYLLLKGGK